MGFNGLKLFGTAALLAAFSLVTGCGGSKSGSDSGGGGGTSSLTISGALSTASVMSATSAAPGKGPYLKGGNGSMSVSLGDLEIYVIYFLGTTVDIVKADVNATSGAWSFSVPSGAQINAIVRNKTSLELVGPITFVDSNTKDMSGNDKESTTYSFKGNAAVGTIALASDGKFKVDVATIASVADTSSSVSSSAFDFSGPWTIKAATLTAAQTAAGYSTACSGNDCHGPQIDEFIYMTRYPGKKFSYSGGNCATYASAHTGSCAEGDGSADPAANLVAAQIWGGGAAIQACGFKTGFSADDARAFGHISISSADMPTLSGGGITTPTQMAFGRVTFTAGAGYGSGTTANCSANNAGVSCYYPWMKSTAVSTHEIWDCKNVNKTGSDSKTYPLQVCKGTLVDSTAAYQANIPGGCVNSAGKPVIVKNWSALNSATPNCSTPANHSALANIKTQSCTYSGVADTVADASTFVCTWGGGLFTDGTATTAYTGNSNWGPNSATKVSAGAACSGISDNLNRYKCYADAYFQDSGRQGSGCSTEYRFNWQAQSASDFVVSTDAMDRPKQNYLTALVNYSTDGNSFTLEDEQTEAVSVQNGTGSIPCRVSRRMSLKGSKVSATQLLVELNQSATLQDTTVAACVGEKNNQNSELYHRMQDNGKFLFTMMK